MLLYNDIEKPNWDQMPFPKKWFKDVLMDKTDQPRGYLKMTAFDHRDQMKNALGPITTGGKKIHEFGYENQIMYWLKRSFAMLNGGVYFSDTGEHLGYEDGSSTEQDTTDMPEGWRYIVHNAEYTYSTHAWITSTDTLAIDAAIPVSTILYPFFPTKMRFGEDGPVDITTPIDPSEINLNDVDAQGAGNTPGKLNFIFISRTQHIAFTTTGYDPTSPSGYYDDYGSVFKNITVFQVTMPASAPSYCYDGKSINEAGLFCDAAITGTKSGLYDQSHGMILAKRYFSTIQKTNTISINWQWSIIA